MLEHAQLVLDGRVSPLLLWEKHALSRWPPRPCCRSCCLLILKRLLFGTRPKIVVQQGSSGRGRGGRG